jgi:hypothetical protein
MGVGEGEDNERQLFEENTRGSQLNGTKLLSSLHSQLSPHFRVLTQPKTQPSLSHSLTLSNILSMELNKERRDLIEYKYLI